MPGPQSSLRRLRKLVCAAEHPRLSFRGEEDVDGRVKPGHDDNNSNQPSTVFPLLITVTLRAFTLASKEITLPSFHISMVTVSPG